MSEHTEGQWKIEVLPSGTEYVTANKSHTICQVLQNKHVEKAQRMADARLIAAAPDLLEALYCNIASCDGVLSKSCDNIATWRRDCYAHTEWRCDACVEESEHSDEYYRSKKQEQAREAIAKAEGDNE